MGPLREDAVDPDPIVQFGRWYADAEARGVLAPDAMTVASATPDGRPSARAVLLRGLDERGFCFFTNFRSRKGRELDANPHAAVLFHWPAVQRQVRATGRVERVSQEESEAYWRNRPRASRVSAWASAQSEPIGSREELEARAAAAEARFAEDDGDVPLPPFWGGYRLVPDELELWEHREDRLHDRLRYTRADDGTWAIDRLQP
ncbi:MAG: pyridoxamine 5'-phosphate oxidase [Acidimicrobiia bacterium]